MKLPICKFALIAAVAALSFAPNAKATIWNLQANLSGANEAPPNLSPGFGSVTLTLNDVANTISITSGTFGGLMANASASHIHGPAPVGVNAGVILGLTVPGATSGSITGGGALSVANVANVLNGLTYVNVHSSAFPGGEIRGQITVVPEPATASLLGIGMIGLAAHVRRRGRANRA